MSWKKTLGTVVVGAILYMSIFAVHKDATLAIGIITQDLILALGLFGLKGYFGTLAKKLEEQSK